jgi:hypothetical protein
MIGKASYIYILQDYIKYITKKGLFPLFSGPTSLTYAFTPEEDRLSLEDRILCILFLETCKD